MSGRFNKMILYYSVIILIALISELTVSKRVFRTFSVLGINICLEQCTRRPLCKAVRYDAEQLTCDLLSGSSSRVNSVNKQVVIERSSWTGVSRCQSGQCELSSVCIIPRQGRAATGRCVTDVTYTCKSDFHQCHNQSTAVCQSSGLWENVTGSCRRNRWTNPDPDTLYNMPCGRTNHFEAIMNITAYQNRTCFDIREGNDKLFHVDFRFNFVYINKTVFNTETAGVWGDEVWLEKNYLVDGQKSEVVISLMKGVYTVKVDGTTIKEFQERRAGRKAEAVIIYPNVTIHSVFINV